MCIRDRESINTKTGESVIITPLFIGVDSSSPLKKANILVHMPNMEAKTILTKSLDSIFSLGVNRLINQNIDVAPNNLNIINPEDPI